jgi:hypothetical protein
MQLAEDLLCHPMSPVRLGKWAVIGECGDWHISIVPHEEPLLLPPFHRFRHGDVKIRVDAYWGLVPRVPRDIGYGPTL